VCVTKCVCVLCGVALNTCVCHKVCVPCVLCGVALDTCVCHKVCVCALVAVDRHLYFKGSNVHNSVGSSFFFSSCFVLEYSAISDTLTRTHTHKQLSIVLFVT
jgi:hypothetical protein